MERFGAKHKWMAFLDGGEFLETTGNETLKEILTKFGEDNGIGALGVNWRMHTSSGLLKRPESARKSFVECIWDDEENGGRNSNNTHVKSIVRTDKAIGPFNPHLWTLKYGARTVGENGDVITTLAFSFPITRDRIALRHYAGKSREEYEQKMPRKTGWTTLKERRFGIRWNICCLVTALRWRSMIHRHLRKNDRRK